MAGRGGIEIDRRDWARLEQKFESLADARRQFLMPMMETVALYVLEQVPPYPPASGAPFQFVSQRQRIFVLAAIREGTIEVPYRRTAQLGRSITTEVRDLGSEVVGVIGTNLEYAPWVISSEETPGGAGPQARYHQGTWWTLQGVVADAWPGAVEVAHEALRAFLEA